MVKVRKCFALWCKTKKSKLCHAAFLASSLWHLDIREVRMDSVLGTRVRGFCTCVMYTHVTDQKLKATGSSYKFKAERLCSELCPIKNKNKFSYFICTWMKKSKYDTLYLLNLILVVEFGTHWINILNLKKQSNWKNYQSEILLIASESKTFSKL